MSKSGLSVSDNRTSVNVPSGSVIRCLLWSWVMGLKKASVEFAVCRLTLAFFSEEAVKQKFIDCTSLLALLLLFFFLFFH